MRIKTSVKVETKLQFDPIFKSYPYNYTYIYIYMYVYMLNMYYIPTVWEIIIRPL